MVDIPNRYRQFARRALVHGANPATASHLQVVESFQTLRERLTRTLAAVFGPVAIDALIERSKHLAASEFAWLADVLPAEPRAPAALIKHSMSQSQGELVDGFAAVLGHEIELLVALVGEDLIVPLVQKAWGPVGRPLMSDESD